MDVKARVSSGDELLNEKFTIPSIITTSNPIDFNTFTTPGIYYVGSRNADNTGNNLKNNGPIDSFGTLFVSGDGGTLFQLFFSDTETKIFHRFYRGRNENLWTNWVTMVDEKSLFDKVFPVGSSFLTGAAKPTLPSLGTWEFHIQGYISSSTNPLSSNFYPIYSVRREA